MAQIVLDVVAEDPQKPEIANYVEQIAMQKHRSENGQKRRRNRIVRSARQSTRQMLRHESELEDQGFKMAPALHLHGNLKKHINQHVQRDDEIIHVWRAESGLIVANGKHSRLGIV